MVPTPHAAALQPELAKLIERLREFANVAQVLDPATSRCVFCIAATDNPAAILAPELIPILKTKAPHIRLAFVLPDKARIAAHLEQGDVDLFIGAAEDVAGGPACKDIVRRGVRHRPSARIIQGGSRPFDLDEFCSLDHLLISTSGGSFSGMVDEALAALGRERRVAVSIQIFSIA